MTPTPAQTFAKAPGHVQLAEHVACADLTPRPEAAAFARTVQGGQQRLHQGVHNPGCGRTSCNRGARVDLPESKPPTRVNMAPQ
ncbi:hypothetical protein [Deinococcus hopiensis]|uniref:hypothetical protein n=1 Tax=Deinococcus hopiensis TaxID=309885 RepID=UPI00111C13C6|nr:hypothetical protein [Deinococcus hopiensis]